jgi:hypothetical protein
VLAKSFAVAVVVLVVLGPGSHLLRVAWRRGGNSRRAASAVTIALFGLVVWLFVPGAPGASAEERIVRFIGAWGVTVMAVGLVVIAAAALGRFRPPDGSDHEK